MMTLDNFILALSFYAILTSLITETIKGCCKNIKCYNLVAVIVALVVGTGGTFIFYILYDTPFTAKAVLIALLMGFFSSIASMCGFDKTKECLEQLNKKGV